MNRRNTPFTLKEAAEEAPTLASLMLAGITLGAVAILPFAAAAAIRVNLR